MARLLALLGFGFLLLGCAKAPDPEGSSVEEQAPPPAAVVETPQPPEPEIDAEYRGRVERWYGEHLAAFEEPVYLKDEVGEVEVVRFVYLPSFDNPLLVRIEKRGEQIVLISKRLTGKGGYDPGELADVTTRELEAKNWEALQAHLEQSGFWMLPTRESGGHIDEHGWYVSGGSTDGAQWIVEARQGGEYHVVDRQSPDDYWARDCAKYKRLCLFMAILAEIDPEELY